MILSLNLKKKKKISELEEELRILKESFEDYKKDIEHQLSVIWNKISLARVKVESVSKE